MELVNFYGPPLWVRACLLDVCVFNGIVLFSCNRTMSCTFIYEAQGLLTPVSGGLPYKLEQGLNVVLISPFLAVCHKTQCESIQESFTDRWKVIVLEIFKVRIPCQQRTKESVVTLANS